MVQAASLKDACMSLARHHKDCTHVLLVHGDLAFDANAVATALADPVSGKRVWYGLRPKPDTLVDASRVEAAMACRSIQTQEDLQGAVQDFDFPFVPEKDAVVEENGMLDTNATARTDQLVAVPVSSVVALATTCRPSGSKSPVVDILFANFTINGVDIFTGTDAFLARYAFLLHESFMLHTETGLRMGRMGMRPRLAKHLRVHYGIGKKHTTAAGAGAGAGAGSTASTSPVEEEEQEEFKRE